MDETDDSKTIGDLVRAWLQFRELKFPKHAERAGLQADTAIRLDEEDDYLVGLVTNFLGIREVAVTPGQENRNQRRLEALVTGEELPAERPRIMRIQLDRGIDLQLAAAEPKTCKRQAVLANWREYRRRMIELALAFAQASRLPLAYGLRAEDGSWMERYWTTEIVPSLDNSTQYEVDAKDQKTTYEFE